MRWRVGDQWASIEGSAASISDAFAVDVHDYRRPTGEVFYARPNSRPYQCRCAAKWLNSGASSATPHTARPPGGCFRRRFRQGLTPQTLLRTY